MLVIIHCSSPTYLSVLQPLALKELHEYYNPVAAIVTHRSSKTIPPVLLPNTPRNTCNVMDDVRTIVSVCSSVVDVKKLCGTESNVIFNNKKIILTNEDISTSDAIAVDGAGSPPYSAAVTTEDDKVL